MTHSFQLYSARNFTPWVDVYKSVSALGYSQVEGFGGVYADPAATRAMLDANNLTMPSGHFSIDELENNLVATLDAAKELGCNHIYCPHLAVEQRPADLAGWQAVAKRLSVIGKNVADKGLRFGWHNHDFEFIRTADGTIPMRVILETASNIDWEVDVAWIARAGSDPSPWIKEFASRITAVHVKDIAADGECIDEDGWADIGHGTLGWKELMQQITAVTEGPLLVAEHDNPSDHERFAKRSLQSLQSYS